MNTRTIPAIYGSLINIGFNINPIFIKETNDWYIMNSKLTKQSEYDMYIMNDNGMCKLLPVEHEYKDQDACLIYFESEQRQVVFDQMPWLLANDFRLFSKPNKVWYKLGKRNEFNKLFLSLKTPIFSKVKELWEKETGSFEDYINWGTLLQTVSASVECTVVYIAAKKRFKFKTEEEFIEDSEFRLGQLEFQEEKKKALQLLKEFGISLIP